MRVISLVPSWSETLIESGVNVCGRTRFCIHPKEKVKGIAVVGGTKDIDWKKVESLKPDLLIFDQEENPKDFAEQCPYPWLATHVTDLASARDEMKKIGEALHNQKILDWAQGWNQLLAKPCGPWSQDQIPGEIKKLPRTGAAKEILYVIWKNPWMVVNQNTFIGSALKFLGAPLASISSDKKYPEILQEELKKHYLLFTSEPFPFQKKESELAAEGFSGSLVDGEGFSWFGIRSLNFLAEAQRKSWETKV